MDFFPSPQLLSPDLWYGIYDLRRGRKAFNHRGTETQRKAYLLLLFPPHRGGWGEETSASVFIRAEIRKVYNNVFTKFLKSSHFVYG